MSMIPGEPPCEEHELDPDSIVIEGYTAEHLAITINCKSCGSIGHFKVPLKEVKWQAPNDIPQVSWVALLDLGLNNYQAYRAWQVIKGAD